MTQVCRTCHADKFEQWDSSVHAALVRNGNPAAPICTDCHNPHAVIKGAAATVEQAPCKNCHARYLHRLPRQHAREGAAAHRRQLCAGLFRLPHRPRGEADRGRHPRPGPRGRLFGCHAGVLEAHQKWLPNAALHFEVVSCTACHAPTAQRQVDLMLIDAKGEARGTEQIGVPLFDASTNSAGKGIDAQTLYNLMQTLNRSGIAGKTVLRGRWTFSPARWRIN